LLEGPLAGWRVDEWQHIDVVHPELVFEDAVCSELIELLNLAPLHLSALLGRLKDRLRSGRHVGLGRYQIRVGRWQRHHTGAVVLL